MPDRVALMAVQNELRRRGRAGGEIEKERIVGARLPIRRELCRRLVAFFIGEPARHVLADGDAGIVARQILEFGGGIGGSNHMADAAARETVGKIVASEQYRRRHDHRAELHRRQHGFPQRRHIAEHEQNAVAAAHAERAQEIGDAVGAFAQLREGKLGFAGALVDQPQRRLRIAARHRIEIIQGPIETVELRPAEIAIGGRIIFAMPDQKIARRQEGCCVIGCHLRSPARRGNKLFLLTRNTARTPLCAIPCQTR